MRANISLAKIFILLLAVIAMHEPAYSSYSRSLDFEEAWREGQFNSSNLENVISLYPSPSTYRLSPEQKEYLLDSNTLTNLRTLDLNSQNVDDNFISALSNNPTFSRLINLDLSNNPNITAQSLAYIFNSTFLGSIRDNLQYTSRRDIPSSEIHVKVENTGIHPDIIKYYNEHPRFDFTIHYLDPVRGYPTAPMVEDSIKRLQIVR